MENTLKDILYKLNPQLESDNEETRTFKLTASKDTLDKIEMLLRLMQSYGRSGHSTTFKLYWDGDGSSRIEVGGSITPDVKDKLLKRAEKDDCDEFSF